ncbi:MAG: hypothetical protein U0470_01260 [Anaerolineae bacterium]
MPERHLYDVAVDAAGTAWFSTDGAGLVACDDARCAISDTGGLVDGATAFGIALDAAGRPWVAQTEGSGGGKAGLVHFDGRSWRRHTTDGLGRPRVRRRRGDDGRVWGDVRRGQRLHAAGRPAAARPVAHARPDRPARRRCAEGLPTACRRRPAGGDRHRAGGPGRGGRLDAAGNRARRPGRSTRRGRG